MNPPKLQICASYGCFSEGKGTCESLGTRGVGAAGRVGEESLKHSMLLGRGLSMAHLPAAVKVKVERGGRGKIHSNR